MFAGNDVVPINSLGLRDSHNAVAVIGANRSGKTVFISNYTLNDMVASFFFLLEDFF
jgi:predicted YcjX-like family ATPase